MYMVHVFTYSFHNRINTNIYTIGVTHSNSLSSLPMHDDSLVAFFSFHTLVAILNRRKASIS